MAADMLIRCVFDGSISLHDTLIERRPYHRNCGCALHGERLKDGRACPHALRSSISFSSKQQCGNCLLQIEASRFSSTLPYPPRMTENRL